MKIILKSKRSKKVVKEAKQVKKPVKEKIQMSGIERHLQRKFSEWYDEDYDVGKDW
jgi:hypothetical protein